MLEFLPPPTPSPAPENAPAAFPEAPRAIVERVEDWDTSCPDWEERILDGRSLVPELPLYEAEAAKALRVFKRLRLPDVIGTPTLGEVCGPWFFPDRGSAVRKSTIRATNIRQHLGGLPTNTEGQLQVEQRRRGDADGAHRQSAAGSGVHVRGADDGNCGDCLQAGARARSGSIRNYRNCSMCKIIMRKITHREVGRDAADQGGRHRCHYGVKSDWDDDR